MHSILQTLRSHFLQVGTAVLAKWLCLLEKLNESRVRSLRTQAALQLRETQYQDLKSKFPLVVEDNKGDEKKKLSEAVAPLAKLDAESAAKDEAYAKLSIELEAVHAAHLRDVALLKEALKEKEQQVSRRSHFKGRVVHQEVGSSCCRVSACSPIETASGFFLLPVSQS